MIRHLRCRKRQGRGSDKQHQNKRGGIRRELAIGNWVQATQWIPWLPTAATQEESAGFECRRGGHLKKKRTRKLESVHTKRRLNGTSTPRTASLFLPALALPPGHHNATVQHAGSSNGFKAKRDPLFGLTPKLKTTSSEAAHSHHAIRDARSRSPPTKPNQEPGEWAPPSRRLGFPPPPLPSQRACPLLASFFAHVSVVQRADHPQRRAPPLPLLVRVALPHADARRFPSPAGFQEGVRLIATVQEIDLGDESLVQRLKEALERDRIFVGGRGCTGIVLCARGTEVRMRRRTRISAR